MTGVQPDGQDQKVGRCVSDLDDPSTLFDQGGGLAAHHPSAVDGPFLVAPAVANELNTVRLPILPIGCWRLNAGRFEFDSSVVLPEAETEIRQLAGLVQANPGAPASLFGHADPVGDDEYNKALAGRRARSVFGLLTRDVASWEQLFSAPHPGDQWGIRSLQRMLARVPSASGDPYGGSIDGIQGPDTTDAIRHFQSEHGLAADGVAGPRTRAALFPAYMDALAGTFVMKPEDFLGRGAAGGKASLQGCGEFNPVRLLTQAENESPNDLEQRNARNAINRRVVLYLFRPGTMIDPARWPCPLASEPSAGCRKQFWADGDARRRPGDVERSYRITRDTFACRFYDGMARFSPCEGVVLRNVQLRLFDNLARPLPNAPFLARFNGKQLRGRADGAGFILLRKVVPPATMEICWRPRPTQDDPTKDDLDESLLHFRLTLFVTAGDHAADEAVRQRLHNLGFNESPELSENVKAFQQHYGRAITGVPGDIEAELIVVHDTWNPRPFVPDAGSAGSDNGP